MCRTIRNIITYSVAVTVIFISCSCTSQNNGVNTQNTDTTSKKAVSQAYDNLDSLLVKDYGNIVLPEKITKSDFENLYKLSLNNSKDVDTDIDYEKEGKEFFKSFFSDKYKDECCKSEQSGGLSYNNDSQYAFYQRQAQAYMDFDNSILLSADNTIETIKLRNKNDTNVVLDGKKISQSDITDKTNKYMTDCFNKYCGDLKLIPYDIQVTDNNLATVIFAMNYKGLNIDAYKGNLFEENSDSTTFYSSTDISCTVNSDLDITNLFYSTYDKVDSAEKLDEIIPLENAVQLVSDGLSEYSHYEFDDVLLLYSSKVTQPFIDVTDGKEEPEWLDDYLKKPIEFTPTWCFICDDEKSGLSRWIVRVDAITGEITIDAPEGKAGV